MTRDGAGLKPIGQIAPNWARARVIYSMLFKYTQQRNASLTENNWVSHLLRPALMRGSQNYKNPEALESLYCSPGLFYYI